MKSGINFHEIWNKLEIKYALPDNLGQSIVSKSKKLCSLGFSVKCFTADYSYFCSTNVKVITL